MNEARPIALISDFGLRDSYVAELKFALIKQYPAFMIIDITHELDPFDLAAAAYLIESTARIAPNGTIFLSAIDPDHHDRLIGWQSPQHIFLGPDNAAFWRLTESWQDGVELGATQAGHTATDLPAGRDRIGVRHDTSSPYRARDVLATVAGRIARGECLSEIGKRIERPDWPPVSRNTLEPGGRLTACVLLIDRFGNVVLDVACADVAADTVEVLAGPYCFQGLREQIDTGPEEFLVLRGSSGYLELVHVRGSAAGVTNLRVGDPVQISARPIGSELS